MTLEAPKTDDEFGDNETTFDMIASHVRIIAEELLIKYWGERCVDFEESCVLCQKWRYLDALLENPFTEPIK